MTDDLVHDLMAHLTAAIRTLRGAGLSTAEVAEIMHRRIGGVTAASMPEVRDKVTSAINGVVEDELAKLRIAATDGASGAGGRPQTFTPNMGAPPGGPASTSSGREHGDATKIEPGPDAGFALGLHRVLNPEAIGDPARTPVVQLGVPNAESPSPDRHTEPDIPSGTVVTDTRMRVCWKDDEGWHRADSPRVLSWAEIVQAVGGPENEPKPGQPMIVQQPMRRADGPTRVRPAGRLDLAVQKVMLDADGQPIINPRTGQPMIRTEKDSVEIGEIEPDA